MPKRAGIMVWKRLRDKDHWVLKLGRETVLTVFKVPGNPRWRVCLDSLGGNWGPNLWLRSKTINGAMREAFRIWHARARLERLRLTTLLESTPEVFS
jgi:hypothetical protein